MSQRQGISEAGQTTEEQVVVHRNLSLGLRNRGCVCVGRKKSMVERGSRRVLKKRILTPRACECKLHGLGSSRNRGEEFV